MIYWGKSIIAPKAARVQLVLRYPYKMHGKKAQSPDIFKWTTNKQTRLMHHFLACLGSKSGKYAGFSADLAVFHSVLVFPELHADTLYYPETHAYIAQNLKSELIPILGDVLYRVEVGKSGHLHVHLVSTAKVEHPKCTYSGLHLDLAKLLVYLSKPIDARFNSANMHTRLSVHAYALLRASCLERLRARPIRKGAQIPKYALEDFLVTRFEPVMRLQIGLRLVTRSTRIDTVLARRVTSRYWFLSNALQR